MKIIIDDESDHLARIGFYQNNKFIAHNVNDLPSILHKTGGKSWLSFGVYHRKNGPARMLYSGHVEYILYGETFSKEKFYKTLKTFYTSSL